MYAERLAIRRACAFVAPIPSRYAPRIRLDYFQLTDNSEEADTSEMYEQPHEPEMHDENDDGDESGNVEPEHEGDDIDGIEDEDTTSRTSVTVLAMQESQCARPIVRFKTLRPHSVTGLNLPARSTWSVPRTGDPPVGPDPGIVPTMALPEGQDQRSIHIDGLRLLYESLKTLCGQNTLESRS